MFRIERKSDGVLDMNTIIFVLSGGMTLKWPFPHFDNLPPCETTFKRTLAMLVSLTFRSATIMAIYFFG